MPVPTIHYLNQYSHNTLTMQSSYSTSFHRFTFAACGVVVRRPDEIAARRAVFQQDRKNLFWNVPFQNVARESAKCRFIVHSSFAFWMILYKNTNLKRLYDDPLRPQPFFTKTAVTPRQLIQSSFVLDTKNTKNRRIAKKKRKLQSFLSFFLRFMPVNIGRNANFGIGGKKRKRQKCVYRVLHCSCSLTTGKASTEARRNGRQARRTGRYDRAVCKPGEGADASLMRLDGESHETRRRAACEPE